MELITIKFRVGENRIYTKSQMNMTINELKHDLEEIFNIPKKFIMLLKQDQLIKNEQLFLTNLNPNEYGLLELELKTTKPLYQLSVDYAYRDLIISDIITVHIQIDKDTFKDIVVEIVYNNNSNVTKPFLGGYYNKDTDLYYYHNFTQTGPILIDNTTRKQRDAQTVYKKNRKLDQHKTKSTQITNLKIYQPTVTDRILTAKQYETADDYQKRILFNICIIQRYYRVWKLKRCLKILSAEYHRRLESNLEFLKQEQIEERQWKQDELISMVYPKKYRDFSILYSLIDRWKFNEIERIKSMYCGSAKIAEFYLLLEKEIEMLQIIDRLRRNLKDNQQSQEECEFFRAITTPIKWISYNNLHVSMDTLETQKSRLFYGLYQKLCDVSPDRDKRINVLLDLKAILYPHKCTVSLELIKLIDRSCEMLIRNFRYDDLKILQKRIETLLFQHFHIDECNENITRYMKKMKQNQMKHNLYYCINCYKLKGIDQYPIDIRTDRLKICTNCHRLVHRIIEPSVNLSPYRYILKQIRRYERSYYQSTSSIIFIMQAKDIYLIVTKIWHGHSALSECNVINQLRLGRWDKSNDWSPWNCILLTQNELKQHMKVIQLTTVYDEHFIKNITNKHLLAKQYYRNCLDFECF